MKIIDKKMRFFGKIHIVFIFVPIVISLFFLIIFRTVKQDPNYVIARIKGGPGNWWWVTPRPPDWLVYSIKVGDKEYNSLGKATAEILDVNVYDAGGPNRDIYVKAKLEVSINKRTKKYRYKGEPLEIGGPIALKLDQTLFPGLVIEILEEKDISKKEFVEKTVLVTCRNQWPWEFDAIKIGETMTSGSDNVIAEILAKNQKPAEREGMTSYGQFVKTYSPIMSDFFITLKLKAEARDEDFIFREEQYLKIGNNVWILFPSYNLSDAEIIRIE